MSKELTYIQLRDLLRINLNPKEDFKKYSADLEGIVIKLKTRLQEEKERNIKLKEELEKQIDLLAIEIRNEERNINELKKKMNKLLDAVQVDLPKDTELQPFSLLEVD